MSTTARFDRAFFFLLDGARVDLFAEHMRRGDLPNLARYLAERGSHQTAISVFPSVTGVAYVPYLTGLLPGRANLPGYRWFDRERYQRRPLSMMRFRNYSGLGSYMMNRDSSKDATTLFELLRPSSNIFSGISRGTGFRRNAAFFRRIPAAIKFFRTGSWDHIDEAGERFLLRAALRRRERFTFHTTYSIDEYSHHHGPFSERVRERYLDFDRVIGRLVGRLKTTGQLDRTLLMMGADHGHTEVKHHFDLEKFVERRGVKTLYFPKKFRNWMGAKAAVMVAGNGMGHVYIKGASTWSDRPTGGELLAEDPSFVDDLLAEEGVDHVIFRPDGSGSVEVRARRGRATIRLEGDLVHYEVHGSDPFDYPPLPATMTRAELLARTADTTYPDAPLQAAQVFDSPRAGDFILSASYGWDLREREGRIDMQSCHGSLHREHMAVPFVTNHPVADLTRVPRSVDAFPTILELLGRPVPAGIDGRSLFVSVAGGRFVVTGGCGFIGSHLCRALVKRGAADVLAIDSLRYGDLSNLGDAPGVRVLRHTLGTDDPTPLHEALRGADGLFHLAAEKHNQSIDSPIAVLRANIEGTHTLYAAAAAAGVHRVVFSSSLYAYGRMSGAPMREDEVPQPATVYGISKLAGERLLAHFTRDGKMSGRALRYFFVYGPRQWAGMGYKSVIMKNAERLLAGRPVLIFGDGEQSLDYVFVDDVVDATIDALLRPVDDPSSLTSNVASGKAVSVNHLLEQLCEVAGRPFVPEHGPADGTAGSRREGDPALMGSQLGWRATTDLRHGLARVWDFVRGNPA